MHMRVLLSRYRAYITCPKCQGGRYQPETLNYKIVGAVYDRRDGAHRAPLRLTLPEFQALSLSDARDQIRSLEISSNDSTARMLRDEICARLNYLCEVGVGYLTLDRSTRTLSGGEVQRVNLTTCLGASLVNTLFVMDEPSVGLHPRDIGQLVRVMHGLRDKGNTLLVVEHEEQIIRAADNLIDLGPGRGEHGGELIWNGALDKFLASDDQSLRSARSLTREYLSGRKSIPVPKSRRRSTSSIKIIGAQQHNLKNISLDIPERRILLSYGSEDMLKQAVHCYLRRDETILLPHQSWWYYKSVAKEVFGREVHYSMKERGGRFVYEFDLPDAGTYWYHPHLGDGEQLARGLYGALIVEERVRLRREPPQMPLQWRGVGRCAS